MAKRKKSSLANTAKMASLANTANMASLANTAKMASLANTASPANTAAKPSTKAKAVPQSFATLAALAPIRMSDTARWQLLFSLGVLGLVIYLLAPILTPFATAALFAYLGDPATDRLQARGLSRTWSVAVVFLCMSLCLTAVLLVLIPLIESQVSKLIEKLPSYVDTLRYRLLPWVQAKFGLSPGLLDVDKLVALAREHWKSAGGVAATVAATVGSSGLALLGWIANLSLIPVLLFYFLRDWDAMVARVRELLPRHLEPTISTLARQSDEVLGAFLRGQLSVMAALATIYSGGLMLVGLDLALLIGIGAGLVSFIPYLGGIVGVSAGLIAAYMQFHDWQHPALVLLVFGIGQSLEGMVLTPLLVGDKIGMHPVAVIFAILAGGQLFGFLGVLLALPTAAIVMVLLRYLHAQYKRSELYVGGPTQQVESRQ
jgi:predicted PurR-regulated permease PerM